MRNKLSPKNQFALEDLSISCNHWMLYEKVYRRGNYRLIRFRDTMKRNSLPLKNDNVTIQSLTFLKNTDHNTMRTWNVLIIVNKTSNWSSISIFDHVLFFIARLRLPDNKRVTRVLCDWDEWYWRLPHTSRASLHETLKKTWNYIKGRTHFSLTSFQLPQSLKAQ